MSARSLLCDGAEAVTAEWMQRALRAGAALGPVQVQAVAVENLGSATNAFGTLLRCRLTVAGDRSLVPATVIVKLPGTSRLALTLARRLLLHQREYVFYRTVAQYAPMRSPALYCAEFDRRSQRFVLVLEDLRGMESVPQAVGVDARQAGLAIRQAAWLHGHFWGRVDSLPLSRLYDCFNPGCARILQTAYLLCLPAALDRFDSHFSPGMRRFAEALGPRVTAHFAAVGAGPRTFIHGDYCAANMFFGIGTGGGFAAIDWQGCGLGCGLYDVAYFMATSVPVEDRRRLERETLEEYHDVVCRKAASGPTFEECWRSYRQNMLGVLLACVVGCGGFQMADRERRRLATTLLRRTLAAIEDLDADEFLPARERSLTLGHGISALSRYGHGAYRFARRLRGKNRP